MDGNDKLRWENLGVEPGMLEALTYAGPRPESGTQNQKRRWSERLANVCAVALADEFRRVPSLKKKRVLPESLEKGTEPLTPLGAGTKKRIDVTIADPVLGLEIGASLKGFNFRDGTNGNYDKNLTGRLYELSDEVRLVHEHLPHAFMAGIFFLPLDSTIDKSSGRSSFAHAVLKLRERTGRLDPALANHFARCDSAYVGLYTTGKESQGYPFGYLRFLNVENQPPMRGRPKLEGMVSLSEMVSEIVARATYTTNIEWSEPESD